MTTTQTTTKRPLTPLDTSKTVRFVGRSRRPEIWEATSKDGRWIYHRLEMPGTPWEIEDTTGAVTDLTWQGSLRACRLLTAETEEAGR